eukprot:352109-Chlamydomonas_euryale.AAC.3
MLLDQDVLLLMVSMAAGNPELFMRDLLLAFNAMPLLEVWGAALLPHGHVPCCGGRLCCHGATFLGVGGGSVATGPRFMISRPVRVQCLCEAAARGAERGCGGRLAFEWAVGGGSDAPRGRIS